MQVFNCMNKKWEEIIDLNIYCKECDSLIKISKSDSYKYILSIPSRSAEILYYLLTCNCKNIIKILIKE